MSITTVSNVKVIKKIEICERSLTKRAIQRELPHTTFIIRENYVYREIDLL